MVGGEEQASVSQDLAFLGQDGLGLFSEDGASLEE